MEKKYNMNPRLPHIAHCSLDKNGAMILMASIMVARGSSFVFSKWLMDDLEPMNVLAVRFCLAFIILAVIFHKKLMLLDKKTFFKGMLLGVGFLTISGGTSTVNAGSLLAILSALIFGVCIVITDYVSREGDPVTMGVLQIGFMGLFSTILTFVVEKPRLPQSGMEWSMILMLALVCSCFGFTFQPLAQKYLSAETAGVFTAINPLSTCLLGILLYGEQADIFKILGGILVVLAVLLSIRKDKVID